jgi:hypothetical protein
MEYQEIIEKLDEVFKYWKAGEREEAFEAYEGLMPNLKSLDNLQVNEREGVVDKLIAMGAVMSIDGLVERSKRGEGLSLAEVASGL